MADARAAELLAPGAADHGHPFSNPGLPTLNPTPSLTLTLTWTPTLNLAQVIFSLVILALMRKAFNLATIAVVGCGATLTVQLLLLIEWEAGPFLAIWYSGKLFGFLSTLASGFIISEIAPKEQLGYWNGINQTFTNLSMAVAPLIFATVYDSVGNVRGQEMLACTAAISLMATLVYARLIPLLPSPPPPKDIKLEDLEVYEQMSDEQYRELPMQIVDQVSHLMLQAGKAPRIVAWGDYTEERPRLSGLQDRALADFKYVPYWPDPGPDPDPKLVADLKQVYESLLSN